MKEIGIYIHIPFCNTKCFYCDFYSETNIDKNTITNYISAVCKEILNNADLLSTRKITSIYIGGGTPSIISPKHIKMLLDTLNLFLNNSIETTIEINPESVNETLLKSYFNMKINRLSMGLQTVNQKSLDIIGRKSDLSKIEHLIKTASKIGFNNISVDCIIGLPNEDLKDFKKTIKYIIKLKNYITHVSAYSLEVHKGTKLDFLIQNGYISLPNDIVERKMKYTLDNTLQNNGYLRYEISNYSKPGFESKHNLKYWNKQEYLGFGASAASYISNTRYTNISDFNKYIELINNNTSTIIEKEELDKLSNIKEYIILKLRLKDGINLDEFKNKFNKELFNLYKNELELLIKQGLLIKNNNNIKLTYKGEDLANLVWEKFV